MGKWKKMATNFVFATSRFCYCILLKLIWGMEVLRNKTFYLSYYRNRRSIFLKRMKSSFFKLSFPFQITFVSSVQLGFSPLDLLKHFTTHFHFLPSANFSVERMEKKILQQLLFVENSSCLELFFSCSNTQKKW